MEERIKVSVLMSTYNERPEYVKEAIHSILIQTYQNIEVLIINDNPEDEIIDTYITSLADNRIHYYRNI